MKLKPLGDRLVIEQLNAETKSAGGILLPDGAQEKPQQGKVIAAGPGAVNDDGSHRSPALKKGDIVYFGKYAGTEVKVDGKEYKIMREQDVLAKVIK
ncbi:MAG: co-chaperone GroES [Planctomycetota bacterium]